MRWFKPSDLTTPNQGKEWRGVCIKSVSYQSRIWQDYIEHNINAAPIFSVSCRFCHKSVKTSIDCDSFGSNETILGNFASLCFHPPVGASKGNWAFVGACDFAPFQLARSETRVRNVSFPLWGVNWIPTAEPSPETLDYYQCASGYFSLEKIQKLVGLGDDLNKSCGSRRMAIHATQEQNFRAHVYR